MRIGIDISVGLTSIGYRNYIEPLLQAMAPLSGDHEFFLCGFYWRGFPDNAYRLALPRLKNFHWALKKCPQRLLLPMEEFLGIRYQERILAGLKLDLFHGTGSLVPRLNRLPSVVTLHYAGPVYFERAWDRFYYNRLTLSSVQQARRVIAISEFTRREAIRNFHLDPEKLVVVHHGGPGPEFHPSSSPEDPLPIVQRPYFLYVGVTRPQKYLPLLAEAFGRLKSAHPTWPHRLVFAGPIEQPVDGLKEIGRRWGVLDQMVFTNYLEQAWVHRLYRQAEAVVCPSLQESFCFPALEAMASGVPAIGVRAGALLETVGDGGLLVEPTPDALAQGMERVVMEPGLREDLIKRGKEHVGRFTWEKTARQTLQVYEEAAKSR